MNEKSNTFRNLAIALGVVAIALVILMVYRGNQAAQQIEQDQVQITTFSNQWQQTTADLEQHKLVITNLETDLTQRKTDILALSNNLAQIEATLADTKTSLKSAQDEITKREEAIAKLESHNKALETEATNLNTTISDLNARIADISAKLVAAEGDKAALTKELTKLLAEKAELERKFNDITALKAQIGKIRTEINIARRLDRAAEGLPASSELKGGQQQLRGLVTPPPKPRNYDLNVEIKTDGSVEVIPPLDRSKVK
ncbi:MAG: hypothetical protein NTZ16_10770 [Verrucomicrobia bacterium]|nr:hypothetical protein [Verrucomicrobiota bacterium]